MIDPRILNPDPVSPPILKSEPAGRPFDFFKIVEDAGMRNVVSTSSPPDIRIHAGETDFKVPRPGRVVYCLAGPNLPLDRQGRAREVLRRLAYGYHDWAAREVVGRYHRDIKRRQAATASVSGKPKFPASVRIRRYLRSNPGASVGEVAASTGIAQPNVSRTLIQWQNEGSIRTKRDGRTVRCYLVEEAPEVLAPPFG